MEFLVVI